MNAMSIFTSPLSNNASIPIPIPPLVAPGYPPATPAASVCTVVEVPEVVGGSDQKQDNDDRDGQYDQRVKSKDVAKSQKQNGKQDGKRKVIEYKQVAPLPAQGGAIVEPERRRVRNEERERRELIADIQNGLMRLLRNLFILQVLGVLIRLRLL